MPHSQADIAKARAILDFEPRVGFVEGVRATVESIVAARSGSSARDRVSTKPQTLGGNASVALAAQLAIFAIGMVISVFVAHALGPSGRGRYYVPVTAVMTCFAVVHLSLEMATTYFHAERLIDLRRLGRVAATVALIAGPMGIGLILGTFALTRTSIFEGVHANDVVLASLALPFLLHGTWMVNLMILGGQLRRAQLALLIAAVWQAVLIGVLALAGHLGVREVLLAYVGNAFASWALLLVWSTGIAPALPTRDGALLGAGRTPRHPDPSRPHRLLPAAALRHLSHQRELGTREVGLYSLAVLVAQLVWTVAQPLATAALPLQTTTDVAEAGRVTLRPTRLCLLVAGSLSVLGRGDDVEGAADRLRPGVRRRLPAACRAAAGCVCDVGRTPDVEPAAT